MTAECGDPDRGYWGDLAMPRPGEVERFRRDCRVMGVLVGMAVGDALGAPYELNGRQSHGRAVFGRGTFGHGVAQWTVDPRTLEYHAATEYGEPYHGPLHCADERDCQAARDEREEGWADNQQPGWRSQLARVRQARIDWQKTLRAQQA